MISAIISRLVIIVFGTLYPAYASYKAVKTKNTKEYVKWMMYWIVFALFTCAETFTDIFFSWFPFYYPIKIVIVIWLLSPATKGSSILYRKFVHPMLTSREQEIDEYIAKAKEQSYKQVLDISAKGVTALMQTAIKNLSMTTTLVASMSESSLNPDQVDNNDQVVRKSRSNHEIGKKLTNGAGDGSDNTADDEDDSEVAFYENVIAKERAIRKIKPKTRGAVGTRKSSRKTATTAKTDLYLELSD